MPTTYPTRVSQEQQVMVTGAMARVSRRPSAAQVVVGSPDTTGRGTRGS
jgi:hypothetical protein